MPSQTSREELKQEVARIADEAGARAVAVACYDYETRSEWDHQGDRWFHAASTIKVPVLLGVFGAVHRGEIALQSRVHVRNRFISVADKSPYRIDGDRDANSKVHQHLGKTMKVNELAFHMIVTSSNLATNLLVDLVGIDAIRASLDELGVTGVELRRGVEDDAAFKKDLNNEVTARGMISVLRPIEEGTAFSVELSARMLEILHEQEFRSGIPAGVPDGVKVANKTGEISTVAHDAAIVYPENQLPYAVVVLTEWKPGGQGGRSDLIKRISGTVYDHLRGKKRGKDA